MLSAEDFRFRLPVARISFSLDISTPLVLCAGVAIQPTGCSTPVAILASGSCERIRNVFARHVRRRHPGVGCGGGFWGRFYLAENEERGGGRRRNLRANPPAIPADWTAALTCDAVTLPNVRE